MSVPNYLLNPRTQQDLNNAVGMYWFSNEKINQWNFYIFYFDLATKNRSFDIGLHQSVCASYRGFFLLALYHPVLGTCNFSDVGPIGMFNTTTICSPFAASAPIFTFPLSTCIVLDDILKLFRN